MSNEMQTISVPKKCIPEGATLVEAYETDKEIIVCGQPEDEPDATALTDEELTRWYETAHNCDAMGCGSLSHVIYRFPKDINEKTLNLVDACHAALEYFGTCECQLESCSNCGSRSAPAKLRAALAPLQSKEEEVKGDA
jgi:hypothetical protein